MLILLTASAPPPGPSGRRGEPYANAYPQSYEMRPAQKVWQYEYGGGSAAAPAAVPPDGAQLELVALAPGVPLLLGYVYRAPHNAAGGAGGEQKVTVASQTTITLHSPEALTVTQPRNRKPT